MKNLIFGIFAFALLCVLTLQGCKKNEKDANSAEALQKTRAWVALQPKFTTHIVNEKLQVFKEDEKWKPHFCCESSKATEFPFVIIFELPA
jgi:hypothetical protein